MYISKQWIESFVSLPKETPEELGEKLTVSTVEVEEVVAQEEALKNIVIGKVERVAAHPNADKLKCCEVNVGSERIPVVCGGSNVTEGMLVAMGMVGAKVRWHGVGDLVELKKTKIRGEVSLGMICAADEIGLGDMFVSEDERAILDLTHIAAKPGTPLADALGLTDVIFDIDNKSMSSRPDLWGHYGMAREFAAMYGLALEPYAAPELTPGTEMAIDVDVQDTKKCPRYMALAMSGIAVGPSPEWMQKKLSAVGLRPINNIVDITNYVMMELGQPMHAFDANILAGTDTEKKIVVRGAKKGEQMLLLGGDEVELSSDILVIADTNRAHAVAGVKGGEDSGVTDATTTIVFEAANFDALSVRRAAAKIGVRTDSSSRFEKGQDPNLPELALKRAVQLVQECCEGAVIISNIADVANFSLAQGPIEITTDRIRSSIGIDLDDKEIVGMLTRLGFTVKLDAGNMAITVPSWRATGDIAIPEDIIEEVARLYGYANIPTTFPRFPIMPAPASPLRDTKKKMKELLAYEAGYTEVYNYSFVSPEWLAKFGIETKNYIELAHPLAKDRPFVRRGLIPNMMVNVESNLHRFDAVRLFETGRGYKKEVKGPLAHPDKKDHLPGQDEYLGLVYAEKGEEKPFYGVSHAIRQVMDRLGLCVRFVPAKESPAHYHGGRHADVFVGDLCIGEIAEIHPSVQKRLGIPYRTAVAELNLSMLAPEVTERIAYTPLPAFPSVERDVALVLHSAAQDMDVRATIMKAHPLVVNVMLFDVYEGDHIEDGKKSAAYRIEYRSAEQTLTSKDVESAHEAVIRALKKAHEAEVRS